METNVNIRAANLTTVQPKSRLRLWALCLVLTLATPMLLTLASVRLVMTPLYLQLEYHRTGFPPDEYGFTLEDRLRYAPYAISYLLNGEDITYLSSLRLPKDKCIAAPSNAGDCAMFNTGELRHMRDVKAVTQFAFWIGIVAATVTGACSYVLWRDTKTRNFVRLGLMNGATLSLSLIAAIVIGAVVNWEFFFNTFHKLFFESGTWRFAYSDTLIRLFPEQFWFDVALVIGALVTLAALAILVAAWHWGKTGLRS